MNELKPCPFCGGRAKYIYSMPFNAVQCRKCKAIGRTVVDSYEQRDGMKEAVDAWNRRDGAQVALAKWLTWEEKFGKKAPKRNDIGVFCTACGLHADNSYTYCPSCGAKMENGLQAVLAEVVE